MYVKAWLQSKPLTKYQSMHTQILIPKTCPFWAGFFDAAFPMGELSTSVFCGLDREVIARLRCPGVLI